MRRLATVGFLFSVFVCFQAGASNCGKLMTSRLSQVDVRHLVSDAQAKVRANIGPAGTLPGTVIASPSKTSPDYFYMWIRDAALTMEVVADRAIIKDFIELSLRQQKSNAKSGLGEPKFNVDGSPFDGPWGRPQNDGPALRAAAAIKFARQMMAEGQVNYVRQNLYDGRLPSQSLIKTDLEFIAHHWRDPNFDLWEETYGRHFYTLLAQKFALNQGADLADSLKDGSAASFYRSEALAIGKTLNDFWDSNRGYLLGTLDQISGPDHSSGLDVAVILGALHSTQGNDHYGVTDDRILATSLKLQKSFAAIYKINQIPQFRELGTAIGRYPEDRYTGYEVGKDPLANPWFLATNAFAELYFRASRQFSTKGAIQITGLNKPFFESLRGLTGVTLKEGETYKSGSTTFAKIVKSLNEDGDRFIARSKFHSDNGHYSEQFHRDTGYVTGAVDLTWSYASLITALLARP